MERRLTNTSRDVDRQETFDTVSDLCCGEPLYLASNEHSSLLTDTSIGYGKHTSTNTLRCIGHANKVIAETEVDPSGIELNRDSNERKHVLISATSSKKPLHSRERTSFFTDISVGHGKHTSTNTSRNIRTSQKKIDTSSKTRLNMRERASFLYDSSVGHTKHTSTSSSRDVADVKTATIDISFVQEKQTLTKTSKDVESVNKVTTDRIVLDPCDVVPPSRVINDPRNVTNTVTSQKKILVNRAWSTFVTDKSVCQEKHTWTYTSRDVECVNTVKSDNVLDQCDTEQLNQDSKKQKDVTKSDTSSKKPPFGRECTPSPRRDISVGHEKQTSTNISRDVENVKTLNSDTVLDQYDDELLHRDIKKQKNATKSDTSSKKIPVWLECTSNPRTDILVGHEKQTSTNISRDVENVKTGNSDTVLDQCDDELLHQDSNKQKNVTKYDTYSKKTPIWLECTPNPRTDILVGHEKQTSTNISRDVENVNTVNSDMVFDQCNDELLHQDSKEKQNVTKYNTSSMQSLNRLKWTLVGHRKQTSSNKSRDVENVRTVTIDTVLDQCDDKQHNRASNKHNNITKYDTSLTKILDSRKSTSFLTDISIGHEKHTSTYTSRDIENDTKVSTDTSVPCAVLPLNRPSNEHQGVTKMLPPIPKNTIEKDAESIRILFDGVSEGKWIGVTNIIGVPGKPKDDRLINVVPEDKSFGMLHYAVHQNRSNWIEILLRFNSCDIRTRSRSYKLNNGMIGKWNAHTLADVLGYGQCADRLSKTSQHDTNKDLDTFCNLQVDTGTFSLLNIALAIYKKTFHPGSIAPDVSIFDLLKRIFQDINASEERWLLIKTQVCSSIENIDHETYETLLNSQTRAEFYQSMIKAYTSEYNRSLYTELNDALRRQKKSNYMPTATDLERSPFVLLYEMILLYWDKLEKECESTYRRMLVTDNDLALYQVGVEFIWMSFVSSSRNELHSTRFPTCNTKGENIIAFELINSIQSSWQPRNIERYASYAEYERTYPAGACFKVIKRETRPDCTHVTVKLINR